MNASLNTTAAEWMDRLSDRLGSLIPGGSRWPSRHPLKVSLVMGVLSTISGGLSSIIGVAINLTSVDLQLRHHGNFILAAAGVVLSLLIVIPWAVWLGAPWHKCLLMLPYCWIGNLCSLVFFRPDVIPPGIAFFLFGLGTGTYLALLSDFLVQQPVRLWALATMLISAGGGVFAMFASYPYRQPTFLPNIIEQFLELYWVLTLLHLPPALCLGYLLWDMNPRPQFEPVEPT